MTKVNELLKLLQANDCLGGFTIRSIPDTAKGKELFVIEAAGFNYATGFNGFRLSAWGDSFEDALDAAIAKLTKGKA